MIGLEIAEFKKGIYNKCIDNHDPRNKSLLRLVVTRIGKTRL